MGQPGKGGQISDVAIVRLAAACPNLIHVSLDGSKYLTDASLIAFFTNYPNLRYVAITGNDKVCGHIKGTARDGLRRSQSWGRCWKRYVLRIRMNMIRSSRERLGAY